MTDAEMGRPFGTMSPAQTRTLIAFPDRFGTLNDFDLERLTLAAICLYGTTEDPAVAAQVAPVFALYHSRAPPIVSIRVDVAPLREQRDFDASCRRLEVALANRAGAA
jgi:hypothetical protein